MTNTVTTDSGKTRIRCMRQKALGKRLGGKDVQSLKASPPLRSYFVIKAKGHFTMEEVS